MLMIALIVALLKGALLLPPDASPGCDPGLAGLFTPSHPQLGRYEVCPTQQPLEAALERGRREGLEYGRIEAIEALDAFGTAGPYDRPTLAMLYGGTRARVAHGWKQRGDRFEAITLISPYPDVSLTRLMSGTMEIRWKCERCGSGRPPNGRLKPHAAGL